MAGAEPLPVIARPGGELLVGDDVAITLQRTLRIPDDGHEYPLPPGFGSFPIRRGVDELLVPMYQSEAMWLSFGWSDIPHAVKVGIGGIDALSGEPFDPLSPSADPQDYLVVPAQPWLDGINAGDGFIRQFVATALGKGQTVEAQLTGQEAKGGLQLVIVPPKPGLFSRPSETRLESVAYGVDAMASPSMGLGAGGRMRQEIFPDEHGVKTWDLSRATLVEIRLCNSEAWRAITGEPPPRTPVDTDAYVRAGLPWFELYSERGDIAPSKRLGEVRSLDELDANAPPASDCVFAMEGGSVHSAEVDGQPVIVTDESALADYADPDDDLGDLTSIHRFADHDERSAWVLAKRVELDRIGARHAVESIDRWLERHPG